MARDAAAFLDGFSLPARAAEPETAVAHLGPTNSGKSHDSLAFLASRGAGAYAAPLRLLAREGYEKLVSLVGDPALVGLLTGEERINPGAPIVACTTELAPLDGEVLVLDEVHWADDRDRGWAWGRLLAAGSHRHVRLVGAPNTEPLLRSAYGPSLTVQRHQRLVPLTWDGTVGPATVPAGSLVVAFSRKAVLALARLLAEASGLRCGVLYGALPPQTRRSEIERFVAGELDVLCVTDVIGHGINLPARTVVLAETSKYDGQRRRPLHLWEVAQIIGRAGRFGLAEHGSAMVLRGVPGLDANASLVRQAVDASSGAAAVGPGITAAQIRPTLADLDAASGVALWEAVSRWQLGAGAALAGHPWLRAAGLDPVAAALDALARAGLLTTLGVAELWRLATLPVDDPEWVVEVARSVAEPHRRLRAATRSVEPTDWTLEEAERVAGRARGLASLANAFPGVGGLDRDELLATEAAAAGRISAVLDREVATTAFGRCGQCGKPAPPWTDRCNRCSGYRPPALRRQGGRPGPKKR